MGYILPMFRDHTAINAIHEAFAKAGFEVRIVGGAVRDLLSGYVPKDFDLCTDATPDEMMQVADRSGLRYEPTGLQHGTISFIIDGEAYEVTTLRIDTDTDGRHATVEFVRDFQQDAMRRDFAFNAMMMDIDGNVYDWFGGLEDLKANRIRFVGNARERIREDYLRILRYFRFAARFSSRGKVVMDEETLRIISEEVEGLSQISAERIWAELSKLMNYHESWDVIQQMFFRGVLSKVGLPFPNPRYQEVKCYQARVASFFYQFPRFATNFCKQMKMSTAETTEICWIANTAFESLLQPQAKWHANVKRIPMEWIKDAACIRYGQEFGKTICAFEPQEFPVRGQDLVDRGMKPGKEMGAMLETLKQHWVDSDYVATRENLLEFLP